MSAADSARTTEGPSLLFFRPFRCRMWAGHYRLPELISDKSCAREIESFLKDGQKLPALGRPVFDSADVDVELIYGARRLFVAQHLGVDLLVDVRDLSDREALIAMEIENGHRKDISPYERGIAYASWLRNGVFSSQKELAKGIAASEAQVSRLLKFAELPAAVVGAFRDPTEIREAWGVALAEHCKESGSRKKVIAMARALVRQAMPRESASTFALLQGASGERARATGRQKDLIVRSRDGRPLFRISYRSLGVHIVLSRDRANEELMADLTQKLRALLERDSTMESSIVGEYNEKVVALHAANQ